MSITPTADDLDLGAVISRHRPGVWVGLGFWAAVALLPTAGASFYLGISREWNDWVIAWSFIAAVLAPIAIVQLWRMRRRWAEVREGGLVLGRGREPAASMYWDDVVAIFRDATQHYLNGIKTRLAITGELRSRHGEAVALDYLVPDVDALLEAAGSFCYPRLHAEAVEALNRGQPFTFGAVTVDLHGGIVMSVPGESDSEPFAWSDIEDVAVREGHLVVHRVPGTGRYEELALRVASVANLPVLLDVVAQVIGEPSPN